MTTTEDLIARYIEGPKLLRAAIEGMTDDELHARPIADQWTTHELICHLADFEPVFVDRIKRMIAEENPTFFGGDPDLFLRGLKYSSRTVSSELQLIDACRQHLAEILVTLELEDFQRTGVHSVNGPMTLEAVLEHITEHIPHHLPFIEQKRAAIAAG